MAITKNPTAADAVASYTVLRAFYWAGEVAPVGAVLPLTKAEAAPLLAATKLTPGGEIAKPDAKPKATKTPTPKEVTAP
jgi:hypothetical protein